MPLRCSSWQRLGRRGEGEVNLIIPGASIEDEVELGCPGVYDISSAVAARVKATPGVKTWSKSH